MLEYIIMQIKAHNEYRITLLKTVLIRFGLIQKSFSLDTVTISYS